MKIRKVLIIAVIAAITFVVLLSIVNSSNQTQVKVAKKITDKISFSTKLSTLEKELQESFDYEEGKKLDKLSGAVIKIESTDGYVDYFTVTINEKYSSLDKVEDANDKVISSLEKKYGKSKLYTLSNKDYYLFDSDDFGNGKYILIVTENIGNGTTNSLLYSNRVYSGQKLIFMNRDYFDLNYSEEKDTMINKETIISILDKVESVIPEGTDYYEIISRFDYMFTCSSSAEGMMMTPEENANGITYDRVLRFFDVDSNKGVTLVLYLYEDKLCDRSIELE